MVPSEKGIGTERPVTVRRVPPLQQTQQLFPSSLTVLFLEVYRNSPPTSTIVCHVAPCVASYLVVLRAVPVLAEASVLLVGIHDLSWRRFLPPVVLSNLGIALAYAKFGELAERNGWLPLALGISVALPLLLAVVARRWILAADERRESTTRR